MKPCHPASTQIMKLSHRLKKIYDQLVPGLAVADLCCDHGYLGLHAYETQLFPKIIFVDQVAHAMQGLEKIYQEHVQDPDNPTEVQFITLDAGALHLPLVGNVVIAGIGGVNMMIMLERLVAAGVLQASTLILAPHRDFHLYEVPELFQFRLVHTEEVTESERRRPIFVFKKR